MNDDRFYERAGPFSLTDIAARIGAEPEKGAPDIKLREVAALEIAKPGDISLFNDSKYCQRLCRHQGQPCHHLRQAGQSAAWREFAGGPQSALGLCAGGAHFYPPARRQLGVRRTEPVHPAAKVGEGTEISPACEISARALIGKNCYIGNSVVIGRGVHFDSLIHVGYNVRISHHSFLVAQVGIGAGARLTARSGVTRDIGVGERVGGYPARPLKRWHRETALLAKMANPKKADEQKQE